MRLSDNEFFSLTPRTYHFLLDEYQNQIRHQELLYGILASCMVNSGAYPPKKAVTPEMFMPSEWHKKIIKPPRKKRMTKAHRAAIAANLRCFLNARLPK